jgi:hypothetical protein
MQMKLASVAQALDVAAGLALAPAVAFAQTAPAAAPATKPAAQPQSADAACAVHKKDSKEFKECAEKHKAAAPKAVNKDPAKKS